MRVLVTGSRGFIGERVLGQLLLDGHEPVGCDQMDGITGDILSPGWSPPAGTEAIIHLAADKYAGAGEEHPARVADLNVRGTDAVVRTGLPVVLASTCKAAAPITAYGASKLIAERIVLNAGGVVVRLVNVVGSTGSVLDIWRGLPDDVPLPVTECQRMWMDDYVAAQLLVGALDLEPGRYCPARHVYRWASPAQIADDHFPGRPVRAVPLRRGDRRVERLVNEDERFGPAPAGFARILDQWELEDRAWRRLRDAGELAA